MDWTDEVIARLRALWAEGHSTAEIGRKMGISKNAVVGKAHRLALPPRPSPIRRTASGEPPKRTVPRRVTGSTLPPLGTQAVASAASTPQRSHSGAEFGFPALTTPSAAEPAARTAPPTAAPHHPGLQAVTRSAGGRHIACCWPIGEPGTRSFRFCDAPSVAGKPYCAEHAALAYVKVRDRREEAA